MESLLELSGEGFVQFLHKTPNEGDVDFVKTGQTCFDTCVVKKATPPLLLHQWGRPFEPFWDPCNEGNE